MEDILVPISICVLLPIAVVLIVSLTKMNGDNKRTQIIIKAIEANKDVDTDKLLEAFKKPQKSAREILNRRLLCGCIFSLIGLVFAVVGIVTLATGGDFDDDASGSFLFGGILLAIGIGYLIVYYVTRNQIDCKGEE